MLSDKEVLIHQKFQHHIREVMSSEDFWAWVSEWYDVEQIIQDALSWDTEMKKEQLDEWGIDDRQPELPLYEKGGQDE